MYLRLEYPTFKLEMSSFTVHLVDHQPQPQIPKKFTTPPPLPKKKEKNEKSVLVVSAICNTTGSF